MHYSMNIACGWHRACSVMGSRKRLPAAALSLLAGITLGAAPLVCADTQVTGPAPFEEAVVRTEQAIQVARKELHYTAETGRIAIRGAETGEPRGHMFYIAYRVRSERERPLAFVWNGGPGANSALLHFEAAGPKRLRDGALLDNADTWLTAMDLVFVDPIGTGFSRPANAEYADEFYGTIGDVASVTEFVRAWRLVHGIENAPLLLIGESWGAGRAGNVGYALAKQGIAVGALVLISGGAGVNDDPVPKALRQALRIADLSTTALRHGRLAPDLGASAEAVRAAAEAWARETYAPALERGDALPESERDAVAAGLAKYSGIPAPAIDRNSLLITPRAFREGLLQESGRNLQIFDMRLIADTTPQPAADEGPDRSQVIPRYLRQTLGYRTTLPYVDLEPLEQAYAPAGAIPESVNARWNYATAELTPKEVEAAIQEAIRHGGGPPKLGPPLPSAADAVALNPRLKVLVAAGRYDSLNSCTANAEIDRYLAPELQNAYEFACFEGGHMMYRDEAARTELARRVRELARSLE